MLDAVGRQKLVEEAAGKSARQVRRMLADLDPELARPADRVRPLGDGRYELKATIDAECPAGAGAAPGAAFARGPAHDDGTARRPGGAGGARPPRPGPGTSPSARRQSVRGREGKRPANSDAGAGAREQRSSGEARRTSGGHRGGAEDRPGRRPPRRFDAGVAVMRFGPRDFGGCQTAGVATRRRALQLRRSTDRAPLQFNASDRLSRCQKRGDQRVRRLESRAAEFRRQHGFDGLQLFGGIHAQVDLGGAHIAVPQPQRHLADVLLAGAR